MKTTFQVRVEIPDEATKAETAHYIRCAVKSHCGGLHPSDPLFHLKRGSVTVKAVPVPKKMRNGVTT